MAELVSKAVAEKGAYMGAYREKQVYSFIENIPGALQKVVAAMRQNGIDVRGLCIADTDAYGVLRMTVSDAAGAVRILRAKNWIANYIEVISVDMRDLDVVLYALARETISVEYSYATTEGRILLKTTAIDAALEVIGLALEPSGHETAVPKPDCSFPIVYEPIF